MASDGEDTTQILGLLNGIAKRDYFGNTEITNEFLKQELFPAMAEEEFETLLSKCDGIFKSIASADMDLNQLEAFLTSHTKKKTGGITQTQAVAFSKFWRNNKTKIHNSVVKKSTFSSTLKDISWRIDIQAQARHLDQINTPTAIVELKLANKNQPEKDDEVLKFELDEEKLSYLTKSLQEIEGRLDSYGK